MVGNFSSNRLSLSGSSLPRTAFERTMTALNRITLALCVAACAALVAAGSASAEEIKYRPNNPSFGGNPFNGPYLLSNATSQRQFAAPERNKPTTAEQFSDAIERSLINRISRDIADQMLGENARESGSFSVGNTNVDFQRQGEQVNIDIYDTETGGSTSISVPVQQF